MWITLSKAYKMTSEERRRRRFSKKFREEQVKLIESGQLSVQDVSRLYEVKAQNVRLWLKKFGKQELPGRILVSHSSEVNRIRDLEKELVCVKLLYGESQVEIAGLRAEVELAKQLLGEDFTKKTKSHY